MADWYVHHAPCGTALVALLDRVYVTENHGADFIFIKVLCKSVNTTACSRASEFKKLSGHGCLKP